MFLPLETEYSQNATLYIITAMYAYRVTNAARMCKCGVRTCSDHFYSWECWSSGLLRSIPRSKVRSVSKVRTAVHLHALPDPFRRRHYVPWKPRESITLTEFYILLTVHLDVILVNGQLDALFSMYFISRLYMFRATNDHHQEDQIVSIHHLV
jgi:hypothetical protein